MAARLRRYARVSFLRVSLYLRRRLEPCPAVPVSQTACTVLLAIVPDLSSCGWDCLCRWQGWKGSRKWHRSSLPLARPRRKPTPLTGAQRSRRKIAKFSTNITWHVTRTPRSSHAPHVGLVGRHEFAAPLARCTASVICSW